MKVNIFFIKKFQPIDVRSKKGAFVDVLIRKDSFLQEPNF